jgi:hypothetical protein
VNGMAVNVNKKITDKITEGKFSEEIEIKDFLGEILIFELEHFEEARPRYMDKYEELINKYITKFEMKEK